MICDTKGSLLSLLYITRVRFRLAGVPVRDAIHRSLLFLFCLILFLFKLLEAVIVFFSSFISFPPSSVVSYMYLFRFHPMRAHAREFPPAPLARHLAGRSRNFNDQKHQRQPVATEKAHNPDVLSSIIYRSFSVSVEGIFHLTFSFFCMQLDFSRCLRKGTTINDNGGFVENRTFPPSSPHFSSSD